MYVFFFLSALMVYYFRLKEMLSFQYTTMSNNHNKKQMLWYILFKVINWETVKVSKVIC